MYLHFIHKGSSRLVVEIYDDASDTPPRLLQQKIVNRYTEKDVRWLANVTNWGLPETNKQLVEFCEQDIEEEAGFEIDPPQELIESWTATQNLPPEQPPFILHVRELTQLKKYGKTYSNVDVCEVLRAALLDTSTPWKEPILDWLDIDSLCCLDIDYHGVEAPPADVIATLVSSLKPQPFCWHQSHGGGVKLYYVAHPGYSAIELASVAGMMWVERHPYATFDLIKSSRHPSYPRTRDQKPAVCAHNEIQYTYGAGDVSSLKRLLTTEVDPSDVEELLSNYGWTMGEMLPHYKCLIDSGGSSDEQKESVFVGDKGLFCHRCQQRGLSGPGGNIPGFVSYASLLSGTDGRLRTMVRNFVHLDHAKIVLSNLYPNIPVKVLETIYRVMLKIVHNPDDPRIYMALSAGRGFIRTAGQWVTLDGVTSLAEGLAQYVKSLPVTLVPREDGFAQNIPVTTALLNSGDISNYGYYDITFLRGCKIYGQFLPYPHTETIKVICRKELENVQPKYLSALRRMPSDEAWGLIESIFPGINRTYVKLLIAAKGASEGRLAQCPFLMVTGVSSAGKSTTVHVAAGICGDKADEPTFYPDVMRFRASLMDAARSSGFVCVNEIFKMAERSHLSYTQALDPMLSLTEDSRSHVLYVGSVPFGRLPVFVFTDITCPDEILQDYQLARRFTFFQLHESIEWTEKLVENHIRPHEIRLISPEHALAADTILSEVIDEFFTVPTPLSVIAQKLNVATTGEIRRTNPEVDASLQVESDDDLDVRADVKELLLKFYHTVCDAPPISGSDAGRYSAHCGWKKIDRAVSSDILTIWNDLCDGTDKNLWGQSRAISAQDWRKLLKTDYVVVCDIKRYQNRIIYLRFRSNDSPKFPMWINGEKKEYPKKK